MIIAAKIAERQLRRFDITQLRNTRLHWNHVPTRLLLLSTTMLLSSVFGYILVIATYVLYGLHLHQLAQAEEFGAKATDFRMTALLPGDSMNTRAWR